MDTYTFHNGWIVAENAYDQDESSSRATVFALANGYMGLRGAGEEVDPSLDGLKGCYINGIYDTPEGKLTEREFPNMPDWTIIRLEVDGEPFSLNSGTILDYRRELDMKAGTMQRAVRWQSPSGKVVSIESERLVSMKRIHLGAIRYRVTPEQDSTVRLVCATNVNVNNRWARHIKTSRLTSSGHVQYVEADTFDPGYTIGVYTVSGLRAEAPCEPPQDYTGNDEAGVIYTCSLSAGQSANLVKIAALHDSRFSQGSLRELCENDGEDAFTAGYGTLRKENAERWADLWSRCDVQIDGDDKALMGMRFSIFQLVAAAPFHNGQVSIPARGLQGQDYYGSIFWDCEIFVFPMFAYCLPEVARNLLGYRIATLPGAQKKADRFGWKGAYYAWQSQENGEEQCDLYVFTNPLTGDKIRSYFADEQIHISSDVVHAFLQYYDATGDESMWVGGGAKVLFEVARFFASRVVWTGEKYEILRVLGPDEYHENVDNNAFTNAFAAETLRRAALVWTDLSLSQGEATDVSAMEVQQWQDILEKLYVPQPDAETRLIEQFDGYFRLRDEEMETTRDRLAHPDLHRGGPLGPFQETQNIKQADVIMLLYLMRDRYDEWTKKANWEYYEPRTSHDSSLSPMAYSLVAADIGLAEWAYQYFIYTSHIDFDASGPHWNMGIHAASLGGAWLAVVHGFCQLILTQGGPRFTKWPRMPKHWEKVSFSFEWHGNRVQCFIEQNGMELVSLAKAPIPVRLPDGEATLAPGQTINRTF